MVHVFQTFTVTQPVKPSECPLLFHKSPLLNSILIQSNPVNRSCKLQFNVPYLLFQCHPCHFFPNVGLNLHVLHPQLAAYPFRLIVFQYSTVWCCNIDVCSLIKVVTDGLSRAGVWHWFSPPFLCIVTAPGWFSSSSHRISTPWSLKYRGPEQLPIAGLVFLCHVMKLKP